MPENNGDLAEAVKARIQALGWSQTTIAARGGPSTTSLTKITKGRGNLSPKMLSQIDAGMDWPTGRAAQILAGEPESVAVELASVSNDALLKEVRRRMKEEPWSATERPEEFVEPTVAHGATPYEALPPIQRGTSPRSSQGSPVKPRRR